jgi:hypothetical protein
MKIYGMGKKTKHGTLTGMKIEHEGKTVMYGKYKKKPLAKNIVDNMLENNWDKRKPEIGGYDPELDEG